MAETGKKIVFEGVDNTSQAAGTAKRTLVDLHETNIKKTKDVNNEIQKGNDLLKEQNALLEKQKQLITSISSQGLTHAQGGMVSQLTGKLFQTPERVNPEHIKSYAQVLGQAGLSGDPKKLSETLIQKLQELIDTTKIQHKEMLYHHLQDDEKNKPGGQNFAALIQSLDAKIKGKKYAEITPEEVQAKTEQIKEEKRIRDIVHGKGEEKGEKAKVPEFMGSIEGIFDKIKEQGLEVLSKTEIAGTNIGVPLAAAGLAAYAYYRYKKAQKDIHAQAQTSFEEKMGQEELEASFSGDLSEAVFGNIAMKRRIHQEQEELYAQQNRFRGVTGTAAKFGGQAINLGLSSSELTQKAVEVASNLGYSASIKNVVQSVMAERAFGVNSSGLERLVRFGGSQDTTRTLSSMIETLGLEKDRTKLNENLDLLVKLGEQHLSVLGRIDQKGTLETIARFQSIGTPLFQNAATLAPIMEGFNQGLTSPRNQFSEAANFAAIQRIAPGASYFQTKLIESQGLNGPLGRKLLNERIQMMKQQFGDNADMTKTALLQSFPNLTPEEIEEFVNGGGTNASFLLGGKTRVKTGEATRKKIEKQIEQGKFATEDEMSRARIKTQFAGGDVGEMPAGKRMTIQDVKKMEEDKMIKLHSATDHASTSMQEMAVRTHDVNEALKNMKAHLTETDAQFQKRFAATFGSKPGQGNKKQ